MSELGVAQRRIVLKSYQQQLTVARRLTRFKMKERIKDALLEGDDTIRQRIEAGLEPIDPDPAKNRGDFVKRAAEELFLSLIFSGEANPITDDIRQELSLALNKDVEFTYPPGGRMRLVVREEGKMRALTDEEQRLVTPVLKHITSQKVDHSMMGSPHSRTVD